MKDLGENLRLSSVRICGFQVGGAVDVIRKSGFYEVQERAEVLEPWEQSQSYGVI